MPEKSTKHSKSSSQSSERLIGVELEFAGLSLSEVASIVEAVHGGKVEKQTSAVYKVLNTKVGDYRVELDAIPLQKLAEKTQHKDSGNHEEKDFLETVVAHAGKKLSESRLDIVPVEIVSPPIHLKDFEQLETLRKSLQENGAQGTSDSIQYSFGLHLNPEVLEQSETYILRHLQSFLLLQPWLMKQHRVDISRRLLSYIDPFDKDYMVQVLRGDYKPDLQALIKDYHSYNPTRNRALDLLPLFAELDEDYVRDLYGPNEKINKRPTFHYRLPNCNIGDAEWSITQEWNLWLKVEELALDHDKLLSLLESWQVHHNKWLASDSEWVDYIEGHAFAS